jgi:FMN-dependent NADH-azoreductase
MTHLLHISCSPRSDSQSRAVGQEFVKAYQAKFDGVKVVHRDLAVSPVPHLDGDTIFAEYIPIESRSENQVMSHQYRMELIKEILDAKDIVLSTPMWNWGPPSVLKAYFDQIILIGVLDSFGEKNLADKSVTIVIATGGGYGPDSWHPEWDFISGFLKVLFTNLGSSDVEIVRTEFTLAGVIPGMESLIPQKEKSFTDSICAVQERVAAL